MNISNVVIKTEAMSEWRRYLKWRILTLAAGLGNMEVFSSNEMGAPNASHLGTGDHAAEPTEADQDQSRSNALVLTRFPVGDFPHGRSRLSGKSRPAMLRNRCR